MKRILYSLAITVAAVVMASCQRHNAVELPDGGMPQVSIDATISNNVIDNASGVSTRVTPAHGTTIAAFEAGDEVGIFMLDEKASKYVHKNVKYTADANVKFATNPAIYYASYDYHQIFAYYPYADTVVDVTAVPVAIALNQTVAGAYAKSDFLSDTVMKVHPQQINPAAPEIPMQFDHRMTSIVVKIRNSDNSELVELPVVKVENLYTRALFNVASQAITSRTTTKPLTEGRIVDSVVMRRNIAGDDPSTNTICYEVIVLPQAVSYGKPIIFIQIGKGSDARTYQYTPAVNGPDLPSGLVQGAEHIFNLIIAGTELTVQGGEIVPWGTGVTIEGNIGGGGVSLGKMIFELKTDAGVMEDEVAKITKAQLTIDGIVREADVEYIVGKSGAKSRLRCLFNQGTDWGYDLQKFTMKDTHGTVILENTAILTNPLPLKGNYISETFNTPIATIDTFTGAVVK